MLAYYDKLVCMKGCGNMNIEYTEVHEFILTQYYYPDHKHDIRIYENHNVMTSINVQTNKTAYSPLQAMIL